MLRVNTDVIDSIPVFKVKGRLDSYGASIFDREVSLLPMDIKHLIVDVSDVDYLSSLGIRSILKLEKSLIARSGGLILIGLNPFLIQVLELSGLLHQFRSTGSLQDAITMAKNAGVPEDETIQQSVDGRKYTITIFPAGDSKLDSWGSFPVEPEKILAPENLKVINLHELGPGYGIGGFGQNRSQAAEVLGEFVAVANLAGVIPADGHCISDFIITASPSDSTLYIASAIGLSGTPSLFLDGGHDKWLTIEELTSDIFSVISNLKDDTPPIIGFVMFAEGRHIVGSHFRHIADISTSSRQTETSSEARGLMIVGATADEIALKSSEYWLVSEFLREGSNHLLGEGRVLHCHGFKFAPFQIQEVSKRMDESIKRMADINQLEGVAHVEPKTEIKSPKVWIYTPSAIRNGAEKLLKIEVEGEGEFPDEWDIISRRIFSDAERIVLTPIHGGFMSKTFHVTSYGRDGRRMLPTVIKIGSVDITRREQEAYHEYVEK